MDSSVRKNNYDMKILAKGKCGGLDSTVEVKQKGDEIIFLFNGKEDDRSEFYVRYTHSIPYKSRSSTETSLKHQEKQNME